MLATNLPIPALEKIIKSGAPLVVFASRKYYYHSIVQSWLEKIRSQYVANDLPELILEKIVKSGGTEIMFTRKKYYQHPMRIRWIADYQRSITASLRVYAINYNILSIMSGSAGFRYAN